MPPENVLTSLAEPRDSLVTMAHIIYGLHTASLAIGITTAATVVSAFIFGIPSIIAVILNYLKRGEAKGTYLESHFRWQIRTFWFGLMWFAIAWFLVFTLIGIPFAVLIFGALAIWFVYRVARGWLRLRDKQPTYA